MLNKWLKNGIYAGIFVSVVFEVCGGILLFHGAGFGAILIALSCALQLAGFYFLRCAIKGITEGFKGFESIMPMAQSMLNDLLKDLK